MSQATQDLVERIFIGSTLFPSEFTRGELMYEDVVSPAEIRDAILNFGRRVVSCIGNGLVAQRLGKEIGYLINTRQSLPNPLGVGEVLYVAQLFDQGRPVRNPEQLIVSEAQLGTFDLKISRVRCVSGRKDEWYPSPQQVRQPIENTSGV